MRRGVIILILIGMVFFSLVFAVAPVGTTMLSDFYPSNNSYLSTTNTIINFTFNHTTNNNYTIMLFASDNSSKLDLANGLVYTKENVSNGTLVSYNLTALPTGANENGLIALWHFDNRSEYGENLTRYYDFSSRGFNLTCALAANRCPSFDATGGKFAGAIEFDGVNHALAYQLSEQLNIKTVSVWIKPKNLVTNQTIFSYTIDTATNSIIRLSIVDNGLLVARLYGINSTGDSSNLDFNISSSNLTLNLWNHIAFTWDNETDNQAKFYINGELIKNETHPFSSLNYSTTVGFFIGALRGPQGPYFNGSLDELAIYNRTLSAEEIRNKYQLAEGAHYWQVNATNGSNSALSNVNEFDIAINTPEVSLISPLDSTSQTNKIIFNCSATDIDGDLSSIELWGNWSSGGWHKEATSTVSGSSASVEFPVNLTYGTFSWNCLAIDASGLSNWSSSNYTFSINNLTSRNILMPLSSNLQSGIETNNSGWINGTTLISSGGLGTLGRNLSNSYDAVFVFNVSDLEKYDYFTFARLIFLSRGNFTDSVANFTISGALLNSAPVFNSSYRPSSVARTNTQIGWIIDEEWTGNVTYSDTVKQFFEYSTPDISDIINEIVSQSDWNQTSKTIAIFIDNNNENISSKNLVQFNFSLNSIKLELGETPVNTIECREFITAVTEDRALVSIIFKDNLDVYVEYGNASGNYPFSSSVYYNATPYANTEISLTNLSENTRYFYRFKVKPASSSMPYFVLTEHNFTTRRTPGSSFEFDHITDTHLGQFLALQNSSNVNMTDYIFSQVMSNQPDFIVDTGDTQQTHANNPNQASNSQKSSDWRYKTVRDYYSNTSLPVYQTLGNHDSEYLFPTAFYLNLYGFLSNYSRNSRLNYWSSPSNATYSYGGGEYKNYYAFDWGDATFIFLDAYSYYPETADNLPSDYTLGETQFNWLNATLSSSDKKWKFVFAHQILGGGYTMGYAYGDGGGNWSQTGDPNYGQQAINPIMERYNAQFYVYGHVHQFAHDWANWSVYNRTNYVNYVATGLATDGQSVGGRVEFYDNDILARGYTRFFVSPNNVTFNFINKTGELLYSYTLNNTAPTINLTSPLNDSTISSFVFEYNYSDLEYDLGKNCSLYVDDVRVATKFGVISNTTNTFSVNSISSGNHNWYINCSDGALSNVSETRSFSVLAESVSDATNTTSGGAPSYSVGGDALQSGYTKSIGRFWKLNFKVGEESHQLKLNSIDFENQTVNITVLSTPQTRILSVGEEWKINFDGDNDYDLLVRLENVTSIRAGVFIQEISEQIISDKVVDEVVVDDPVVIKEGSINLWKLIGVVVLVIVLLIGVFFIGKRYFRK